MIAVDTQVLVYAHRRDSPWHSEARSRLAELAEGDAPWAIPWPCVTEFLAVVTHARIYRPPTPLAVALEQVEAWLESPSVSLLVEDGAPWPELRDLLAATGTTGPTVHDARTSVLCRSRGVTTLWSADRDHKRFPGLHVTNPLAAVHPTLR